MCPLTNDRGSYKHDKYFRYSNRFQGGTGSILVFGDAWSLYPSRFEHQIVLIKFTSSGHGCWMSWKIHIVASKTKTPPSHQPISFAKCGSRNQPVSQTPRYHYSRHRSSDRRTQWTLDVSRHMSGPRGFLSGFKGKKSDLSELLKLFPCSLRICFFCQKKKHPSYAWHSLVRDYLRNYDSREMSTFEVDSFPVQGDQNHVSCQISHIKSWISTINQSPKGYLKSAFLTIPTMPWFANPASWELQSLHVLKLKISVRGLL